MAPGDTEAVRDFAVAEETFTVPYAAYLMALPVARVTTAVRKLVDRGVLRLVEPPVRGRYGGPAVWGYAPIDALPVTSRRSVRRFVSEEPLVVMPDLAPERGVAVATTGVVHGPSGRPGRDRKRQELGHRIKRQRQGT